MAIPIKPGPDLSATSFYFESFDSIDTNSDVSLIREIGDKLCASEGTNGTIDSNALTEESTRISKIVFFEPEKHLGKELVTKISNSISYFNASNWNLDITAFVENWQYTTYDSSKKGHYDWHLDLDSKWDSSPRKLSAIIQLSDPSEYEGGDLMFKIGGEKYEYTASKNKGALIIFPSYILHKVSPVTSGTRRSLVMWAAGPKLR